jgi:hypothetical protein
MRDGGERSVPRAEAPGPRDRADDERDDIAAVGLAGDPRGERAEPPAIENVREQGRRPPGEEVEEQVEMRAGGDVEQRDVFRCGSLTDWPLAL